MLSDCSKRGFVEVGNRELKAVIELSTNSMAMPQEWLRRK